MKKGLVAGATLALCAALTVPGGFVQPARADDWGVDVSHWQGCSMSFAGVDDFVIAKVGGSDAGVYTDSCYGTFSSRVRQQGKRLGHYWFSGAGTGAQQADWMIARLQHYHQGDALAFDTEAQWTSPAKAAAWAKRMRQRGFSNLYVYTSQGNLRSYNWSSVVSQGVRLWVARYGANSGSVVSSGAISYWPSWTIHQYTSNGTIRGFSGRLDGNRAKSGAWTNGSGGTAASSGSTPIYTALTATNRWGYRITQIQRLLNAKIGAGLVVDGIQGPKTTAAVKNFQRRTGHLAVDGIVGPQTWRSLNAGVSSSLQVDGALGRLSVTRLQQVLGTTRDGVLSSQSSWSRSHWTTMVRATTGARGSSAVRALQRRLHVSADGHLGPQTIRAWQRHLGVRADGWLGPQSARAIQRALNQGRI